MQKEVEILRVKVTCNAMWNSCRTPRTNHRPAANCPLRPEQTCRKLLFLGTCPKIYRGTVAIAGNCGGGCSSALLASDSYELSHGIIVHTYREPFRLSILKRSACCAPQVGSAGIRLWSKVPEQRNRVQQLVLGHCKTEWLGQARGCRFEDPYTTASDSL